MPSVSVTRRRSSRGAASSAGKRLIVRGRWRRISCGSRSSASAWSRNSSARGPNDTSALRAASRTSCGASMGSSAGRKRGLPMACMARAACACTSRSALCDSSSSTSSNGGEGCRRMARARARGASGKRVFMSASLMRCIVVRGPAGGDQADEGGGLHQRARVLHRGAQQLLVVRRGMRARSAAARISAFWWSSSRSATGTKSVRPDAPEQVQRAQDHVARRVVEDERGDEAHAPFLRQQVQRRHHLDVVAAVERGEERLQRAEVELRQRRRGRASCPRAARRGTARGSAAAGRWPRRSTPRTARPPPATSTTSPRRSTISLRMNTEARAWPPRWPTTSIKRLDARAQAVGDGQEQQLGAGAVQRVAQRAVGALQQQRQHQAAAERHAGRRPAGAAPAAPTARGAGRSTRSSQPISSELRDQGEQVQHHVEGGEEASGRSARRCSAATALLKT